MKAQWDTAFPKRVALGVCGILLNGAYTARSTVICAPPHRDLIRIGGQ